VHAGHNGHQFEIVHVGDPQARHASNHTQVQPITDDEDWLTPELRQQMEELLKDVDMGN
jgi:hypothetical protein